MNHILNHYGKIKGRQDGLSNCILDCYCHTKDALDFNEGENLPAIDCCEHCCEMWEAHNNDMNIILQTDSYKVSHWKQYPKGTTHVYSYFESRGGQYKSTLFFGLQYYLKKYLTDRRITKYHIKKAETFFAKHFGNKDLFNKAGWEHILNDHQGMLPVEIKAVPEGTLVPTQNVLFTVENTCPQDFWLTSYLETLLEKVWYPTTIATKSFDQKIAIKHWLDITGSDIPAFKLHDFGYRGSTSEESARIGGAAHLLNFMGTDTLAAILCAQDYYQADMPAFSIPAAEHSTITSWGKDNEAEAYENILDQFPKGLVAVVSDSYDVFNAVSKIWGEKLKDKITGRDGTLVIRPDSGEPVEVLLKVLNILEAKFGTTTNEKGYKVLPPQIRLIQGDGIDEKSLPTILEALAWHKWSADNIAFGSGGGLLQNVTRDTLKFAYKCSSITVDGKDRGVSKDPITDPGKKSKEGKVFLAKKVIEGYSTGVIGVDDYRLNQLQTVFKNGELLIDDNFTEIRMRAEEAL